jgi:nitrogen fixation NifU-like protein
LTDLYEKVLVDHAKRPRNFGPLAAATHRAQGSNPLCGDEISVQVQLASGVIEAIAFEGAGCAVCMGSASMMTGAVLKSRANDFGEMMQRIEALVRGAGDPAKSGDLGSLAGVARFPARVKCALLPWTALEAALAGADVKVSTEL